MPVSRTSAGFAWSSADEGASPGSGQYLLPPGVRHLEPDGLHFFLRQCGLRARSSIRAKIVARALPESRGRAMRSFTGASSPQCCRPSTSTGSSGWNCADRDIDRGDRARTHGHGAAISSTAASLTSRPRQSSSTLASPTLFSTPSTRIFFKASVISGRCASSQRLSRAGPR
jgi:hypothetical protein